MLIKDEDTFTLETHAHGIVHIKISAIGGSRLHNAVFDYMRDFPYKELGTTFDEPRYDPFSETSVIHGSRLRRP